MGIRIQYQARAFPLNQSYPGSSPPVSPVLGDVTLTFTKIVQYQAHFYPLQEIQAPAEDVTLDKWFQPTAQPVRKRRAFGIETVVLPPPQLDGSRLDSWVQPPSQPVYPKKPPVRVGWITDGALLETPNTITLDKWFQEVKQPYPRKKRLVAVGAYVIDAKQLTLTEDPLLKWLLPVQAQSVRRQRPQQGTLLLVPFVEEAPAETITLDKWLGFALQPGRKRSFIYGLPSFFPDDFPRVPDILAQTAQTRRLAPFRPPSGLVEPPYTVPLDFIVERAEIFRRRLRQPLTQETAPLLVEDLSWLVSQVEIFRATRHPLYNELIQIIEPILQVVSATAPIETLTAADRGYLLSALDRALERSGNERGFSDRARDRKLGVTGKKRDFEI